MDTSLFLGSFIIYVVFCIWLGWFVSRKQSTGEEFLLAGRGLPLLLVMGTTVATMVGTGSSMGAVGMGYQNGWAGALYGIGGACGILSLGYLFSPVQKLRFMTMSEELSYYVGGSILIKNLVGVLVLVASVGWLGAHILGGGLYLAWIADIELSQAKVIVAVAFAVYVIIGGYTAVVWTDTIQALILFSGFLLMALFSVHHIGGLENLYNGMEASAVSFLAIDKLGWLPALSLAVVVAVGVMATPSYRQRIYSAKNEQTVRRSFLFSGVLYLLFSIVPAVIGMAAHAINPELENSNFAFPYLATEVLPLGIALVVLIAGLSATMSSASSDAIAGASILLCDVLTMVTGNPVWESRAIKYSRFALVVVIGVALIFALSSNDIISYITKMVSTLISGMFVVGILGRFWPSYNWQGALSSLLSASVCSFVVMMNDDWSRFWGNPVIPSVVISIFAGVTTSIIFKESKTVS